MSKTLHNGLEILELLAQYPHGLSLSEISDALGLHRTVAHRLVRTLEAHRLCRRDDHKRISLGTGLVTLAESVEQDLRTLARPVLEELADAVEATAHLVVRESADTVRAMMVIEPRHSDVHIAFRPGQVHPLDRGSAGLAILASMPPRPEERPEVQRARTRGYAVSTGEVVSTTIGISAAVPYRPGGTQAAVGVSVFDASDEERVGAAVLAAAGRLAELLG
ncbi:IclR family transcriptional regulator [Rhodococcus sp. Z13]|uniref:IclR family transcriptional regulator n=1 Tax=Rhodococcus sacchari TaxID=2962047 RepID=A0ACD4DFA0_9NOCA|nr:IclR family transcriptional regulator [Rhodococcus sp. Z13]UYP18726.1 IclR family transcriptional regulator [Rhodococcus sp. Z13]